MSGLFVVPTARRQGIGKLLLADAEAQCLEWGYREMLLHVQSQNREAFDFYRDCGFAEVSEAPRETFFSRLAGGHPLLLRKPLKP